MENNKRTAILCSAAWCGPCKTVKEVIKESGANVRVIDFDDPDDKPIFIENGVKSVPTLLILNDGIIVQKITGLLDVVKAVENL